MSAFNCHNPIGKKLILRLRLGLSHLRDRKFKHNFLDWLKPICYCGKDIETTFHYVFIAQVFQMKDQFFSTTFEASMKMF